MKRLTPRLTALALAALLAGTAEAAKQNLPTQRRGGPQTRPETETKEVPKPGVVPHRCDAAWLQSAVEGLDSGSAVSDTKGYLSDTPSKKKYVDFQKSPVCDRSVFTSIDKNPVLRAVWNQGPLRAQLQILRYSDEVFNQIDVKTFALFAASEEVYVAAESLGAIKRTAPTNLGVVMQSAGGAGKPSPLYTAIKAFDMSFGDGKTDPAKAKDSLAALLAADPAKKDAPPVAGPKIEAFNKALQDVWATVNNLRDSDATLRKYGIIVQAKDFNPPAEMSRQSITATADAAKRPADIKAFADALTHVQEIAGGKKWADFDPRTGALFDYIDWGERNAIAMHYDNIDNKLWGKLGEVVKGAGGNVGALLAGGDDHADVNASNVGDLEKQIKQQTLTKLGLDSIYDNTKGAFKEDATAEEKAAYQAVQAGKVQNIQGGGQQFVYTKPQAKLPTVVPIGQTADKQADVASVAQSVADDLLAGNPTSARLKAAKAALLSPAVQAAPGDVQGDAAAPGKSLTNLAGPSAATGLKSGCDGKTLADYKKAQADKLRGKDADQSKERQEIEAKYADKLTEAQQNLDAKVPPQKPWETEADYNARVDKNPSAKKAFQDANTSADAWYADQVKKLGTREAQAAKLKQGIAESDKASETKLRGQIRDRIESLRTDFGKSGTDVSENEVPAEMARKYVKPESWANQLDKGDVDAFFASQFSPSQRGSKSGEESGLYKQNLEWCFSGQVRVENDGSDTERCVGRLLGAYLSDRAAGRGRAGPPAKKTTADDRRKAINRKQRCVELGLPETCSDDDIKAKSGN